MPNLVEGQNRGVVEAISKGVMVVNFGNGVRVEYSENKFNSQVKKAVRRGDYVLFQVDGGKIVSTAFSNESLRNRL